MRGQIKILNKFIYVAMIVVVGFTSLGFTSNENEKKIHSNITIENIDVGKLTKKQAIKKLEAKLSFKGFLYCLGK